ncbi:MAG: DUF4349 domain-containing protein [Terricaulis sp.]
MRRFVAGLILAGALAACGQDTMPATEEAAAPEMDARMASGEAVQDALIAGAAAPAPAAPANEPGDTSNSRGQGTPGAPSQPNGPAPVLFLAYAYQMGLEIPSERLSGLVEAHVQACQSAGPRSCQLVGSNVSGDPESTMNGYVSLRGEPNWLRTFMSGLEAQADAAGGRILAETTNTEDLTRQIVDTEARQRAQTSLRDRLQRLLDSRPGRLSDLLEVERELARVQAEIDALQSNLAVMRTRVAMSELTLQYQSSPKPLRGDTFRPLGDAFAGFLGIVVAGFAAIITIIAGLLPFAIVLVPIVWAILRWRRARGGRFFGRKAEQAPAKSE